MSAHAYTEDQQAPRTLTRPLPKGEEIEQPAIGLFAEYSAGPNPHPQPFSHSANPHPSLSQWERSWEKGGRQAGLRVRSLLPPEAIAAAMDELTRDRSSVSLEAGPLNLKTY